MIDQDADVISEFNVMLDQKQSAGLQFVYAKSVKEAMKQLSEGTFDLIVLEVILPVINGYYFLDYLKKQSISLPVILFTRLKGEQDLAKAVSYPLANLFIKQITKIDQLIDYLTHYSGEKADLNQRITDIRQELKTIDQNNEDQAVKILQCPRCNIILNRNSRFCNNCGQKIFKKTPSLKVVDQPPPSLSEKPSPSN